MFIERLTNDEFSDLCKMLLNKKEYALEIKKINKNKYELNNIASNLPCPESIFMNDFSAKIYYYQPNFTDKKCLNKILRNYMYIKFGEEYLQSLKKYLEDETKKRIKKMKNYNKKVIEDLKKENNKSKDIYEEILDKFKTDLDRFPTTKEKVEYLKSLGFDVKIKDNKENPENLEK